MQTGFSEALTRLRHERGLSQKQAAADLGISQALLSHYENGIREPRLEFVIRACDYYQVSADRILGRGLEDDARGQAVTETAKRLLCRLEEVNGDSASAAVICFQNAAEALLYMLDQPGRVLPPEMLIREQQGFAELLRTLTDEG